MRCSWLLVLLVIGLLFASTAGAQSTAGLEAQVKKMQEQIEKQQAELKSLQDAVKAETTERKVEVAKKADMAALDSLKLKTDNVKIGGDIRLRGENYDNVWDLGQPRLGVKDANDSWDTYRFRTRLSFDANVAEDMRGYIRLVNEYRWGSSPDSIAVDASKDIALDNAYIEWKNVMDSNVTLKLGRQDLVYGEGFLILDGTPWDGSRTIGFDALKATINLDKTTVDVFLAKVFENVQGLNDDETLYGLYVTNKTLANHTIEAYALYKNANGAYATGAPGCTKVIPPSNVITVGTRVSGKLTDALSYAGEIAGQWGDVKDAALSGATATSEQNDAAIGGYLHGTYAFKELSLKPELTAGITYLDPDWDDMYGTWPKYSELLIYMLYDGFDVMKPVNIDPSRSAWTNMYFPSIDLTVKPTDKLSATIGYKLFTAVEERSGVQVMPGVGTNNKMGDLYQGLVKYQFTKNLSSHALLEYFQPGAYYPNASDSAYFSRWELMLTF